jgi:tetratricopeptide (TPR) repeat protein
MRFRRRSGESNPDGVLRLLALAELRQEEGDVPASVEALEAALPLLQRLITSDPGQWAHVFAQTSSWASQGRLGLGDVTAAVRRSDDAIAACEAIVDTAGKAGLIALVITLTHRVRLGFALDDFGGSASAATRAVVAERVLAQDDPDEWTPVIVDSLTQIVQLHALAGDHQQALAAAAEYLDLCDARPDDIEIRTSAYEALQNAVYLTMGRRGRAMREHDERGDPGP